MLVGENDMQIQHTDRGFEFIECRGLRLQQSSAIRNYEDAYEKPGSSCLWYDDDHLDREQVRAHIDLDQMIDEFKPHAEVWLRTGSLVLETD
jgi:hypothetical protein